MTRGKYLWGWLVGAAMVLGLIAGTLNWTGVRHQLALSFTRIPEQYTKLYFGQEPVRTVESGSGRRQAIVDFFIENHKGQPVVYHFSVTALEKGGASRSVEGDAQVEANQVLQVKQVLVLSADWDKISVQLLGRTEYLQYFNPRRS